MFRCGSEPMRRRRVCRSHARAQRKRRPAERACLQAATTCNLYVKKALRLLCNITNLLFVALQVAYVTIAGNYVKGASLTDGSATWGQKIAGAGYQQARLGAPPCWPCQALFNVRGSARML